MGKELPSCYSAWCELGPDAWAAGSLGIGRKGVPLPLFAAAAAAFELTGVSEQQFRGGGVIQGWREDLGPTRAGGMIWEMEGVSQVS